MLTSILRTVVPALWGAIVGWVLTILPVLEPLREQLLEYGCAEVPFIAALLIEPGTRSGGNWSRVCRTGTP